MAALKIIATYHAQDIGKARTLRDAIKADGRQAFLTRDGGQIVLHAEPSLAVPLLVGGANHG
jgi:hypothetical protein